MRPIKFTEYPREESPYQQPRLHILAAAAVQPADSGIGRCRWPATLKLLVTTSSAVGVPQGQMASV